VVVCCWQKTLCNAFAVTLSGCTLRLHSHPPSLSSNPHSPTTPPKPQPQPLHNTKQRRPRPSSRGDPLPRLPPDFPHQVHVHPCRHLRQQPRLWGGAPQHPRPAGPGGPRLPAGRALRAQPQPAHADDRARGMEQQRAHAAVCVDDGGGGRAAAAQGRVALGARELAVCCGRVSMARACLQGFAVAGVERGRVVGWRWGIFGW